MVKTAVVWVTPPEKMIEALELYGEQVLVKVRAVAQYIAGKMQNEARQNAPWEDRSGAARSGLFGDVEMETAEALVTIYLSHGFTVTYGQFLELCHGAKYSIVMPVIEQNLPELKRMLDDLFA